MDRTIVDYTVLEQDDLDYLKALVIALIVQGWIPQGGITAYKDSGTIWYLQAMVQLEED